MYDISNHTSDLCSEIDHPDFYVYCPECPPGGGGGGGGEGRGGGGGGTIVYPGGQQKRFLPFGHRRDLVAFNGTGLHNKSFQDWAEISKA